MNTWTENNITLAQCQTILHDSKTAFSREEKRAVANDLNATNTPCNVSEREARATFPAKPSPRQQVKELEKIEALVLKAWKKTFELSKQSEDCGALREMLAGLEACQSSAQRIQRQ